MRNTVSCPDITMALFTHLRICVSGWKSELRTWTPPDDTLRQQWEAYSKLCVYVLCVRFEHSALSYARYNQILTSSIMSSAFLSEYLKNAASSLVAATEAASSDGKANKFVIFYPVPGGNYVAVPYAKPTVLSIRNVSGQNYLRIFHPLFVCVMYVDRPNLYCLFLFSIWNIS